ncbi:MAG: protein kinase [Gemmatimonadales bacterium]
MTLGGVYTLEREVGRGGMALVYLARDHKHDRPVAVKVLREEVAANLGAQRFLLEIGTAARLQHPHIVPIYDSGSWDSRLYLVMPYIDGESLRERLEREQRLPLSEALRLTVEVAEALSFAHSRNVVHRDIKPENILLYQRHAMVVDFGIAKALSSRETETVTVDGMFVGTPLYMAPEQMFGDPPVDERADIYGLATVLYEMLEGSPPFTGPSAVAILSRKAAMPASAPRRPIDELPPHVERALLKALERERDQRFASVADFAEALTASPAKPVSARRASTTTTPSVAVLPFVNASADPENEYFSDGISEDLIHALSRLPTLRVVARTSAFAFKGRVPDVRAIGAELGVATILTGSVRRSGTRIRITTDLMDVATGLALWSERYDRELTDVFAVQDEISRAIVDTLRVRLLGGPARIVDTPTANFSAYESYLKGRFEWSQRTPASMARALEHLNHAVAADPAFTLAFAGLADCYLTLAIYGVVAPADAMPQAIAAADQALLLQPGSPDALTARASVRALYRFDWRGAEADYLAALAAREQSPVTHQWYAMHLLAPRGRLAEARAHVARARELDPLSPPIAASAGILRLYERDAERAVHELGLVLEQHPAFGLAHYFQGLALTELGRHAAAIAALDRAALLSGGSAETRSALALAHARGGNAAASREIVASLARAADDGYVSPVLFAQNYAALGETDRALESLESALAGRAADLPLVTLRPSFDLLAGLPRFGAILTALEG